MLARTADSLFWLGRYMERAGNVARGLNATQRMAALAAPRGLEEVEWAALLDSTGGADHYRTLYGEPTPAQVRDWLTTDTLNPSSIAACFEAARRNARAVRTALTVDMWEAVNDTWIDLRKHDPAGADGERMMGFLDWVRTRAVLFNGAAMDTMLRDDAWRFVHLGVMLERADNTARFLAAREAAFAEDAPEDAANYAQWQGVLRSVSALRAYQHLFREKVKPSRVIEILLLRHEHPRSVMACYDEICRILADLAVMDGGDRFACRRLAADLKSNCASQHAGHILRDGLPEFLRGVIAGNARLGDAIWRCFLSG